MFYIYVLPPVLAMALAAWDWFRWATDLPPAPKTLTVVAVAVGTYCAWRPTQIRKTLRNLRLGRDGERAVGEYLDRMRSPVTRVLHDLVGDEFNIDHVFIAPQGVLPSRPRSGASPCSDMRRFASTVRGFPSVADRMILQ
jgi:hypothetical protein